MSRAELETRVDGGTDDLAEGSAGSSLVESLVGVIDRIGRYVLLERLGRGSFGTVWGAFDPQLDRRVAIKIVRATRRDADSHTNLLSEAQLLAQLSHPNVVAIHDVGRLEDARASAPSLTDSSSSSDRRAEPSSVADGLSGISAGGGSAGASSGCASESQLDPQRGIFIVMEHLAGPTLAEWLRPNAPELLERSTHGSVQAGTGPFASLGPRVPFPGLADAELRPSEDVLRVFLEAGRGLAAAHARDLVHLDFKPGNVMFGADGRVRVLDFGLARVGRRVRTGTKTRTRVAGTPAYMAPEQHAGELADARADQYAFCVALWEALYGARPFPGTEVEAVYRAKLAGPPKTGVNVRLAHVHAALERGLKVDPRERFASMAELLDVLADDPRIRRRRVVAGVTLVAGLLGLGFGLARAADVQTDPCTLPADQFTAVWDAPRRAAVEAAFEATGVGFAAETFAQVERSLDEHIAHWSAVRRAVCRATLVEAEVPVEQMSEELLCLDRQLRSVAGLSEALAHADAEIVARARDSILALEDPERCRLHSPSEAATSLGQDRRLALLSVEDALARARVHGELGRYEVGLEAANRAVELARALEDPSTLARAERERGTLLRELGRLDESRDALMGAIASAAARGPRELESQILDELVATHTARGEYAAALALRELLAARVDPARSPELAGHVHVHASVLHERQQHWDEALAELDAALALVEAKVNLPVWLQAQVHLNYGNVLVSSNRDYERGASEYARAIELLTAAYGAHHPLISKARMNLGAIHFRHGEYEQAIATLDAALAEFSVIFDGDHPYVTGCHQNLGAIHMVTGSIPAAIDHTRESLAAAGRQLGTEHPDYATVERNLGAMLMLDGQLLSAAEHIEHAAEVYAASLEADDSRRMAVATEQGELAWWLGDAAAAEVHASEAARGLAQAEVTDLRRLGPLSLLALLATDAGDYEQGHVHAEALVEFIEATLGPSHPDLARARVQLAAALRGLGQLDAARTQLDLAAAALARGDGWHPYAWQVFRERGRVALAAGDPAAARELYQTALGLVGEVELHRALVEYELAAVPGTDRPHADELRARAQARVHALGLPEDLLARVAHP